MFARDSTAAGALCLGLLVALVLGFFLPRLLWNPGYFVGGFDVGQHVYWDQMYIKSRLTSGELPFWNPHSYAGHPFLANPGTYVFYPSTLLTVLLPLPLAITADTILHVLAAGAGMFLLVRHVSGSPIGGLCAAVVYALNGHYVDRIWAGHMNTIHALPWLPWLAWALERATDSNRLVWGVPAAFFLALGFLGGDLQNPYYFCVGLSLYAGARALAARRLTPVLTLVLAAPLALLLAAAQFLPSLEFFSLSDRAAATYDFATFFSFPPANFATYLLPHLDVAPIAVNWELTGYAGVATLALAAVGALAWRPRSYALTLCGLAVFAVTVMLGSHTPIYRVYYAVLPGLASFRVPARCVSLLLFSLAILAGLGVAACIGNGGRTRALLIGATAAAAAGVLAVATAMGLSPGEPGVLRALAFAAVPVPLALLWRSPHARGIGALLLVGGLYVDLLLNFGQRVPLLPAASIDAAGSLEQAAREGAGRFRVATALNAGRAVGLGYDGVNAYTPMVLGDYFRFAHEMAGVPAPPLVRHTLSAAVFEQDHPFLNQLLNVRYRVTASGDVYEESPFNPRAFLVPAATVVPDFEEQVRLLRSDDFDPAAVVLLAAAPNGNTAPSAIGDPGDDETRIVRYAPERVEIATNAPRPSYLVLADQYYPGWEATVDGSPAQVSRADLVLRAVHVPAGSHEVVFTYRPRFFRFGALLSCATVLGMATWVLWARRRHLI